MRKGPWLEYLAVERCVTAIWSQRCGKTLINSSYSFLVIKVSENLENTKKRNEILAAGSCNARKKKITSAHCSVCFRFFLLFLLNAPRRGWSAVAAMRVTQNHDEDDDDQAPVVGRSNR